jgi:histidinol dehydrogenase
MIAGPSEILVVADAKSNPKFVAADLLSQAEHDRMASAVLVTDSREFAEKVSEELEIQIPMLPRKDIARESIDKNGKIIVAENNLVPLDLHLV